LVVEVTENEEEEAAAILVVGFCVVRLSWGLDSRRLQKINLFYEA
jgi:hypothetical protein